MVVHPWTLSHTLKCCCIILYQVQTCRKSSIHNSNVWLTSHRYGQHNVIAQEFNSLCFIFVRWHCYCKTWHILKSFQLTFKLHTQGRHFFKNYLCVFFVVKNYILQFFWKTKRITDLLCTVYQFLWLSNQYFQLCKIIKSWIEQLSQFHCISQFLLKRVKPIAKSMFLLPCM